MCRPNLSVHKFSKDLNILSFRRVTWSKSNSEDPQIFGATIQNLVDLATRICALLANSLFISHQVRSRRNDFILGGSLTLRLLMSYIYIYIYIYIYMEHLFLMFLDHTQRRSKVGRTPLDE